MGNRTRAVTGASTLTLACLLAGAATAQSVSLPLQAEPAEAEEAVPTVVVDDATRGAAGRPYRLGDLLDSGSVTFTQKSIEDRASGSGDVNELLSQLPTAHFSRSAAAATRDSLRDLRPTEVSISGGRPSENLFLIDGVGVNSMMELLDPTLTSGSAIHYDSVAGASAQSNWVDSSLVGEMTVRDSNVSAEFGRFTGGVVDIVTRDPSPMFGMRAGYSYTGDNLTHYKLSPNLEAQLADNLPDKPQYGRERWNVSVDLPVNENLSLLAAYSLSEAYTTSTWSAGLGAGEYDSFSTSENYLLKLATNLPGDLRFTAQVNHAPYRSETTRSSAIDGLIVTHGGGTTARMELAGERGMAEWSVKASYAFSDNDREAAQDYYTRPSQGEDWCLSGTCYEGGMGPINQRQKDTNLNGTWSQPLWGGDLRLGFDFSNVEAQKIRLGDSHIYSAPSYSAATVCAVATDRACVAGRYALANMVIYPAYNAEVSLQSYALWGELTRTLGAYDVRLGLRYDHETFLGDHNFSPRLSVARALPWGFNATFGLNRYHGRSYLGYAMREKLSHTETWTRTATVVNGQNVWSDNWRQTRDTLPTQYSGQGLDTPYSDEATLALTGPVLGGDVRLRGIYRESRKQFSRSLVERIVHDDLGVPRNVNSYRMENGGESSYEGIDFSYSRPIANHTLTFSTSWSETHSSSIDYYDPSDDDLHEATMVVYQGEIISLTDLLAENQRQNYSAPFVGNLDWQSVWLDDRLTVTVGGRYRGSFTRLEDTGVNQSISGTSYDVYGPVTYKPSLDVDANVSFELLRGDRSARLEARISNLFDTIPNRNVAYSSQPWQTGRTIWLGLNVRY
ncbi:hypothetical protein [Brevundimonas sp. GCM10030266]|uniref:hypothetical protein n=1 Tax=Brevundimonas sp. GCM10030266 TaxID=3273386 RepID=UPI003609B4BE